MIRLSVFYPSTEGATFDHDYYRNKHVPLCLKTWGLDSAEIDKGVDGPYVAAVHFKFASPDALGRSDGCCGYRRRACRRCQLHLNRASATDQRDRGVDQVGVPDLRRPSRNRLTSPQANFCGPVRVLLTRPWVSQHHGSTGADRQAVRGLDRPAQLTCTGGSNQSDLNGPTPR